MKGELKKKTINLIQTLQELNNKTQMHICHIRAFFVTSYYTYTVYQNISTSYDSVSDEYRVWLFLFSCLDDTPELTKWTGRMLEDPAVKATMHTPDAHKAFYKTFVDGKPDYDYGL